jgi:hypothetical protein
VIFLLSLGGKDNKKITHTSKLIFFKLLKLKISLHDWRKQCLHHFSS